MKTFGAALFAVSVALGATSAQAATLNACPASFTMDGSDARVYYGANLTAAGNCQYLTPPDTSNVANATNVNAAGFFGTNTWAATSVLQFDPSNDQTGSWTVPSVNFAAYDYMIVFKDGSDTNLIGFLLNEEASTGSWKTPFTDPPFNFNNNQTKNVSHFSIFQRTGSITYDPCVADPQAPGCNPGDPAPEPATMALVGLGLLGASIARRRKQ
jgi:hypothetical protein